MEPSDLKLLEPHGMGAPLGDPTEIRSLVRASSDITAPICGIKGNLGHLEPAAGTAGLLVLATGLKARHAGSCAQLRVLNPKIQDATRAGAGIKFPGQLAAASLRSDAAASAGVSSFGFSGTIAHTVMRAVATAPPLALVQPSALAFRGRRFAWRVLSSSLLGIPLGQTDEGLLFLAPIAEPLVAIARRRRPNRRPGLPAAFSSAPLPERSRVHRSPTTSCRSGSSSRARATSRLRARPPCTPRTAAPSRAHSCRCARRRAWASRRPLALT